jgi:antitoxin ParD1/3/4
MPNVAKVSVALTGEMAELLELAVKSGDYASASEVVREALREWKGRRLDRDTTRENIRRLWIEGLESGPGRIGDINAIKAEARRRADRRKRT